MITFKLSALLNELTSNQPTDGSWWEGGNTCYYSRSYLCFVAKNLAYKLGDPEHAFNDIGFQMQLYRMLQRVCDIDLDHSLGDWAFDQLRYGFDCIIDNGDLLKFMYVGIHHMQSLTGGSCSDLPEVLKLKQYDVESSQHRVYSVHRYSCRVGMLVTMLNELGDLEFVFC